MKFKDASQKKYYSIGNGLVEPHQQVHYETSDPKDKVNMYNGTSASLNSSSVVTSGKKRRVTPTPVPSIAAKIQQVKIKSASTPRTITTTKTKAAATGRSSLAKHAESSIGDVSSPSNLSDSFGSPSSSVTIKSSAKSKLLLKQPSSFSAKPMNIASTPVSKTISNTNTINSDRKVDLIRFEMKEERVSHSPTQSNARRRSPVKSCISSRTPTNTTRQKQNAK